MNERKSRPGRPPGPRRVRLNTTVLPETLSAIDRRAAGGPRGPVVDEAVGVLVGEGNTIEKEPT